MPPATSSPAAPKIVVVGSINMDLVARMHRLPRPGETVSGEEFETIPGGKGANQAVAAARLGAQVSMIARVGDDSFGESLRQSLISNGVDTRHVLTTTECSSGVALIGVEASGANSITVIPAANGRLSVEDVEANRALIAEADALVVQLESPIPTIAKAIEIAQSHGILTVLDPAPAPANPLPPALMSVDIISPNQTEAEALTGVVVDDWATAEKAACRLQELGAKNVVLKMGELGAFVLARDGTIERVAARKATVVDTTAAGDAFTGAMTVAQCEGKSLRDAAEFGCLAGTVACTRRGAQPAMPTRDDLSNLINT